SVRGCEAANSPFAFAEFPVSARFQPVPGLDLPPRPLDRHLLDRRRRPEAKEDSRVAHREVTSTTLGEPRESAVGRFQNHGRADDVAVIFADQFHTQPAVRCRGPDFVAKNRHWAVAVAKHQVGPTVVVEVADRKPATGLGGLEESPACWAAVLEEAATLAI